MDRIPNTELAQRRASLLKSLRGAVGVVFAGDADPHLEHPWRPDTHFEYLTGVTDEPGAVLLLDPGNPVARLRATLLLRPLNPEVEKWDGLRETLGSALKERVGFEHVVRVGLLPRMLNEAVKRSRRLACLHGLATYSAPVSPDLALFRKIVERVPGATIEDSSELIPRMRAAKSTSEVDLIQRAIDITTVGFREAMTTVRPGMNEFDVQEIIEHAYRTNGARGNAFRTIAGSGINSTVLHYHANDRTLEDGDLMVMDSGARFAGYSADITRTIPVSGRFSPRQREVYEIVLKALKAGIAAARAGVRIAAIDTAARNVIRKAGYGDAFIHGIGHHLGLDTHDSSPDQPLQAGAVLTVEPGIYLPEEKIGIRIEDDIVVGRRGSTVLTGAVPREADEIEALMTGSAPRRRTGGARRAATGRTTTRKAASKSTTTRKKKKTTRTSTTRRR